MFVRKVFDNLQDNAMKNLICLLRILKVTLRSLPVVGISSQRDCLVFSSLQETPKRGIKCYQEDEPSF